MSARGEEKAGGVAANVGVAAKTGAGDKAVAKSAAAGKSVSTDKIAKQQKRAKQGFDYVKSAMVDYPAPIKGVYNFVLGVVWVWGCIFWPTTIEGEDEFVAYAKSHGCVLIMNHTSMVEPVVLLTKMWRRGVALRPVYKAEFEKIGPAKWLFRHLGGIPVERGTADLKALKAARDAVRRGEVVLVYPEGTRIKSDDQVIETHGGYAMMAQMGKGDVVPSAVVGAADPYKTRPTRRRKPKIRFGEPISFDSLGVTGKKAQLAEMERVAMAEVYRMRDELRVEYPGLW